MPAPLEAYFEAVCASAVQGEYGLILAVEDGYAASDVFLAVDAASAHTPEATFCNPDLATLLADMPLPIVGAVRSAPEGADTVESWAMRQGYARDRVIAYAECKRHALLDTKAGIAEAVSKPLRQVEEDVLSMDVDEMPRVDDRLRDARRAWSASSASKDGALCRQATFRNTHLVTGRTLACVQALLGDPEPRHEVLEAEAHDKRMGRERFVSFVFPAADHPILTATGSSNGGVPTSDATCAYPAYVTVHNSKGAIENFPATETEARPNSFVVPDAVALLSRLHTLALAAHKNPLVLAHECKA